MVKKTNKQTHKCDTTFLEGRCFDDVTAVAEKQQQITGCLIQATSEGFPLAAEVQLCENLHGRDFPPEPEAKLVTTGQHCVTAVMKNSTGRDGGASAYVLIHWKQIKTAAAPAGEVYN